MKRTRLASESRRIDQTLGLDPLRREFAHTAWQQLRAPNHEIVHQLDALRRDLGARLDVTPGNRARVR